MYVVPEGERDLDERRDTLWWPGDVCVQGLSVRMLNANRRVTHIFRFLSLRGCWRNAPEL